MMVPRSVYVLTVFVFLSAVTYGEISFDRSPYIHPNSFSLTIDPEQGNIFISSLSYGDKYNMYELTDNEIPSGSAISAFNTNPYVSLKSIVNARNNQTLADAVNYESSLPNRYVPGMDQEAQMIYTRLQRSTPLPGISYNSGTKHLFIPESFLPVNYRLRELSSSIDRIDFEKLLDRGYRYKDVGYDFAVESFYGDDIDSDIFSRYSINENEIYASILISVLVFYALSSVMKSSYFQS